MIIQNYDKLSSNSRLKDALDILESGLSAAFPDESLKKIIKSNKIIVNKKTINLSNYENIYVVAYGKAADSMTKTIQELLDIKSGFIVIPKGSKSIVQSKKYLVFNSGHPEPNQISVKAAKTILKFLKKRRKNDFVLFLVSGGGSALLSLPDQITLDDKAYTTNLLLRSGATIHEINCVRKHLSQIKGGKLVQDLPCDGIALVMSDVVDNDLSSISSGCTYYDDTTFRDALQIIKKYELEKNMPLEIMNHMYSGIYEKIPETPKKSKIINHVILTNASCLDAMIKKAKQLGYTTKKLTLFDNVKDAAPKLVSEVTEDKRLCIIFGGETTVQVIGKGKGGRNQELVLRILKNMQKIKQPIVVASIGTDGIDGNTKFAGAISENTKIDSDTIKSYLKNNDSSSFFEKYGGLIKTGHTHTNLMDIGLILI